MKIIISTITYGICSILGSLCFVWTAIEFILYLFKDEIFNWNSLWLTITFFALSFIFMIITFILSKDKTNIRDKYSDTKQSEFQKRLEQIKKNMNKN